MTKSLDEIRQSLNRVPKGCCAFCHELVSLSIGFTTLTGQGALFCSTEHARQWLRENGQADLANMMIDDTPDPPKVLGAVAVVASLVCVGGQVAKSKVTPNASVRRPKPEEVHRDATSAASPDLPRTALPLLQRYER